MRATTSARAHATVARPRASARTSRSRVDVTATRAASVKTSLVNGTRARVVACRASRRDDGDELETHETIDGPRNKWELESAKFDGAHVPGAHTREEYEWLGLGHPKSNYLKPPREGKNGYDGETWGALGPIDGKNLK